MLSFLSRYESSAYGLLRVVVGVMFAMHGSQKLLDWPAPGPDLKAQLYIAGAIELICGLQIAIGLLTRPAALLSAVLMVAAFFVAHFNAASFPAGWLPILNQGEMAVLYCVVFVYIAMRGPGCCSVDGKIWKSEG